MTIRLAGDSIVADWPLGPTTWTLSFRTPGKACIKPTSMPFNCSGAVQRQLKVASRSAWPSSSWAASGAAGLGSPSKSAGSAADASCTDASAHCAPAVGVNSVCAWRSLAAIVRTAARCSSVRGACSKPSMLSSGLSSAISNSPPSIDTRNSATPCTWAPGSWADAMVGSASTRNAEASDVAKADATDSENRELDRFGEARPGLGQTGSRGREMRPLTAQLPCCLTCMDDLSLLEGVVTRPHLPKQECVHVGTLFQLLLLGVADSVAGVVVQAQQDGFAARARYHEASRGLGAFPHFDARIVGASRQQQLRIRRSVLHVRIGAHCGQSPEARFGLDRAEFGDVRDAVGGELGAQGVESASLGDHSREQVGPLCHRAPDQDAAGAAAEDAELGCSRISLGDQVLRARDEVLPGVRLGGLEAAAVPVLAEHAGAPRIGDREPSAGIQPDESRVTEERLFGDAIRTVTVEQGRIVAVQLDALAINDGHRHHRTVVALNERLAGFDISRRVVWAHRLQAGIAHLFVGHHGVYLRRPRPALQVDHHPGQEWIGGAGVGLTVVQFECTFNGKRDAPQFGARFVPELEQVLHVAFSRLDV